VEGTSTPSCPQRSGAASAGSTLPTIRTRSRREEHDGRDRYSDEHRGAEELRRLERSAERRVRRIEERTGPHAGKVSGDIDRASNGST
jgi:hypothetical protein